MWEWIRPGVRRRDLVREMEDLIEEGTAEGLLQPDEEEMLLSVLSFRRTRVREIMVPRTDIVAAERDEPLEAVVARMVEHGHSRIPVHEGDLDRVVGVVTARDVLRHWGQAPPHPPLETLLHPALFVPETLTLERLLAEFKRQRTHFALAVDEYGGVSGLVTLGDVLEEIVGEIQDLHETGSGEIEETREGLRVDARTEIEKLEERLGVDLAAQGFETVGGLVFRELGRIPKPGETFRYRGLEITVRDADKRRVKEVTIRPLGRGGPHSGTPSRRSER